MNVYLDYKRHLPKPFVMGTLIRRRQDPEYVTELLHEVGTTDVAIGDATAEVMITTLGKIPNEMYDLEETTARAMAAAVAHHDTQTLANENSSSNTSEFAAHSTLFITLISILGIVLCICCVAACIIARARRRFLDSSDMECSRDCSGAKQPLIKVNKNSDNTSKSTGTSTRN